MALKLAGRNPAKFEFTDGVSETTVTVQPDDPPEAVRAKLQRVLELEGVAPPAQPLPGLTAPAPADPVVLAAERAATEARLARASSTMGWGEDADLDNLPEV
jgi:hypothetical protein